MRATSTPRSTTSSRTADTRPSRVSPGSRRKFTAAPMSCGITLGTEAPPSIIVGAAVVHTRG